MQKVSLKNSLYEKVFFEQKEMESLFKVPTVGHCILFALFFSFGSNFCHLSLFFLFPFCWAFCLVNFAMVLSIVLFFKTPSLSKGTILTLNMPFNCTEKIDLAHYVCRKTLGWEHSQNKGLGWGGSNVWPYILQMSVTYGL